MTDTLHTISVEVNGTLRHAQVREDAGPGGAEMLMWAALMGAMRDAPANIVMYEAVQEWMGGVGLLSYARSLARP